jgi:hypothetical protein
MDEMIDHEGRCDSLKASTNLPTWAIVLMLATCVATNATEDMALATCYEAGHLPAECDP